MIIAAKSEYIYCANTTYSNLREYEEVFSLEANIINHAKCSLLRNEELDDFYACGTYVSVYGNGNNYNLYFDQYHMEIETYDKQIVNFKTERN